ncbi:hypothetical protein GR183_00295 [Stappia sp. GBMRC 2046]|uniref:Thaumarchaeal output domain-containing protein n=1 Tax=Stappia sediminis TaxID=2692190 RepID=A0A7X3S5L1_9HYPH|nr:hypothetical protein [Stappia sediminis]MXN63328.1 hypothetical protein [Stappia sediminis]
MKGKAGGNNKPYAIVLTAFLADRLIERLLRKISNPLVPVISMEADEREWFDASGPDCFDAARAIIERLEDLPETVRLSGNTEDILLARMYSRERDLIADYDPRKPAMVGYRVLGGQLGDACETAHALFRRGFLNRTFFDRLHVCPQCRSSALNVREECCKCRSPQIGEETVVHHFPCGFEAVEGEFRQTADGLYCPKCSQLLRHIGLDYDKPGSAIVCKSCGAVDDSTAVGFVCMHCRSRHDAGRMPVQDWYSYQLTPAGLQALLGGGTDPRKPDVETDHFKVLLQQAIRHEAAFGTPFQVLKGVYDPAEDFRSHSLRLAEQSEHLVSDVLRSALRPVDTVAPCENGMLILLTHMSEADAQKVISEIDHRMAEVVLHDPGLRFHILSRSECEQIAGET